MKVFAALCLIIASCSTALAHTITGTIVDSHNNAMPQCAVLLYDTLNDTIALAGTGSDNDGRFTLSAPAGNYRLHISLLGMQPVWQPIALQQDTCIGTITLATEVFSKQEVMVTAPYITYRDNGNIVVNIPGNPIAANCTAMDLLYRTPGTWGLTVYGRRITKLYINGIEQNATHDEMETLLRNIDAERIHSIEIVPYTHDDFHRQVAEAALLVSLKEAPSGGLLLSAGYSPSMDIGTSIAHDFFVNAAASYKGLQSYTIFEGSVSPREGDGLHNDWTYSYPDGNTISAMRDRDHWFAHFTINQSLVYEIDSANTLSANFNALLQPHDSSWEETLLIENNTAVVMPDSVRADRLITQHNYSAFAAYNHAFAPGGSHIEASLHYFRYDYTCRLQQQNFYGTHNVMLNDFAHRYDTRSNAINPSVKARFVLPRNMELTTTLQYIYTHKHSNHLEAMGIDYTRNLPMQSHEHFTSFDAGFTAAFGPLNIDAALHLQYIGGRYFYGPEGGNIFYHNAALSPFVKLRLNEDSEHGYATTLSYSSTPVTPTPEMLNPTLRRTGEYYYEQGNSDLQATYTHTVQLQQHFFNDLTLSLAAQWQPRAIDRTITVGSDGRSLYYRYDNYGNEAQYRASLLYNRNLFPWWHINAQASFIYYHYNNAALGIASLPAGDFALANSFAWGNGWTASLEARYRTGERTLYTQFASGYGISASLGKTFFDNRLALQLIATDFYTNLWCDSSTQLAGYTLHDHYDYTSRCFAISLTYRLGVGNKNVGAGEVATGNATLRAL